MRYFLVMVVAASLGSGCGGPENGTNAVRAFDRDAFVATVQPIVAERCANPSCHGRLERPLALYAPMRFRLDPTRTHIDEPLTAREVDHNFWASAFLSTEAERAEESLFLAKPLAQIRYHGGGAIFDSAEDAEYRALLVWVSDGYLEGGQK